MIKEYCYNFTKVVGFVNLIWNSLYVKEEQTTSSFFHRSLPHPQLTQNLLPLPPHPTWTSRTSYPYQHPSSRASSSVWSLSRFPATHRNQRPLEGNLSCHFAHLSPSTRPGREGRASGGQAALFLHLPCQRTSLSCAAAGGSRLRCALGGLQKRSPGLQLRGAENRYAFRWRGEKCL